MHEGGSLTWREVVEKYHLALVDELTERLDSDLRDAVSSAVAAERSEARAQASAQLKRSCDEARRAQVESLNQVLRRLRTTGEENVLELLAEGCAPYAEQLVVLVFENNQVRSVATFGIAKRGIEDGALCFDASSAPAIVAAIDSRDPVIALATEAEISPALTQAFDIAPDQKAYLFPVITRQTVVAMLIASGVQVSAPIELLCEAAGMRLETSRQPAAPVLVKSASIQSAALPSKAISWDNLTAEDQKLHLLAQRTARVRVAEMRLYNENELRSGIAGGDIYGALQTEIDAAREQFLQQFLSKSATMVDYLHLEVLRSLASDDDRLLGHSYPGPMV
jgi:hypothetical protein